MTDRILTSEEGSAVKHLKNLFIQGEKLRAVESFPGKNRTLDEWRTQVDSFIEAEYKDFHSFSTSSIMIYITWYLRDPSSLERTTDEDRKRALEMYKDGIQQYGAIINGMISSIKLRGLPSSRKQTGLESNKQTSPQFHTHINPSFNPTFSQSQNQTQDQTFTLNQQINEAVKAVEENYGDEHAKQMKILLTQVEKEPSKWGNLQKVIKYAADLGKDATIAVLPVLARILLSPKP